MTTPQHPPLLAMASFFTSLKKRALIRKELKDWNGEEPDSEANAQVAADKLDRLLQHRYGVSAAIAPAIIEHSHRGGWHYDPESIAMLERAKMRENTPAFYSAPGRSSEPEGEEDALEVSKSKSDHTNEIAKMPYDFFVGQPPFRGILVGSTMSGKTTLQQFLIRKHYGPYFKATGGGIIYISKTADTDEVMFNPELRRYMVTYEGIEFEKGEQAYTKIDEKRLRALAERQKDRIKEVGKARAPQYLLVLNDFASSGDMMKSELFDELNMLWRHFNFSTLVDTQQFVRLSTRARANFQIAFLFDAVGYEMEHYEDEARVRMMRRDAFRDMFQYALRVPEEEKQKLVERARQSGELVPDAAKGYYFITINRQTDPHYWYRQNLKTILLITDEGWLAAPHDIAHSANPRYLKRSLLKAPNPDTEEENPPAKKQKKTPKP